MKYILGIKRMLITILLGCGLAHFVVAQGGYNDVHIQGGEAGCEASAPTALAPKPEDCTDPAAHAAPTAAPAKVTAPKPSIQQKNSAGIISRIFPNNLPQTGGSIEEDLDPAEVEDFWRKQEDAMQQRNTLKEQDGEDTNNIGANENFRDGVEVSQIEASDVPMILATIEANQELGEHASADVITKSLPTTLAWAFKYHPEDMIVVALLLAALLAITFI